MNKNPSTQNCIHKRASHAARVSVRLTVRRLWQGPDPGRRGDKGSSVHREHQSGAAEGASCCKGRQRQVHDAVGAKCGDAVPHDVVLVSCLHHAAVQHNYPQQGRPVRPERCVNESVTVPVRVRGETELTTKLHYDDVV